MQSNTLGARSVPMLQQAVQSLGTPAFGRSLFAYLDSAVALHFVTVFIYRFPEDKPLVVLAAAASDPNWERRLSNAYLEHFWQYDPVTRDLIDGCSKGGTGCARTRAIDIRDDQYRHECYSTKSVRERLSLSTRLGPECIRINLFRGSGGPYFSENEIGWLVCQTALLGAMSWRHHQLDGLRISTHRWEPPELERRLSSVSGVLSPRERQVGARIAAGWTSDAIAADLGLSRNSILTFRRRLYTKLRVNSVARLNRLIDGA